MPSGKHEGLVELVRDQPSLVAEVLASLLGIQVPQFAGHNLILFPGRLDD